MRPETCLRCKQVFAERRQVGVGGIHRTADLCIQELARAVAQLQAKLERNDPNDPQTIDEPKGVP